MRIIKLEKSKEILKKCSNCASLLGFLEHEILQEKGQWERTSTDSSERTVEKYVKCPACDYRIVLNKYKEVF